MRIVKTVLLAALLGGATGGTALGADVTVLATSAPGIPGEMAVHGGGFDWSGFYAGIYGGVQQETGADTRLGLGIQAGVNAQFDFYLVGAEVAVHGLTGGGVGDGGYGQLLGRAGLVVSDDVLVYAAGGYGLNLGTPAQDAALLGGGVEISLTDSLSLDAQYLRGVPLSGGNANNQFTLGANFHF